MFSTWVTKLTKRLKANPDYRQPGDFLLESLCEGKQSDSEKLKSLPLTQAQQVQLWAMANRFFPQDFDPLINPVGDPRDDRREAMNRLYRFIRSLRVHQKNFSSGMPFASRRIIVPLSSAAQPLLCGRRGLDRCPGWEVVFLFPRHAAGVLRRNSSGLSSRSADLSGLYPTGALPALPGVPVPALLSGGLPHRGAGKGPYLSVQSLPEGYGSHHLFEGTE